MLRAGFIPVILLVVASCGDSASGVLLNTKFPLMSTTALWIEHSNTQSFSELLRIEAELGSRGETRFASSHLGEKTSTYIGLQRFDRSGNATRDKFNCSDFSSGAAAQKAFLKSGGPALDPHNLDGDGDGFACEWGTDVKRIARSQKRSIARRAKGRYRSSSRCYVGPRGGTYTITASGRKNYSGC